MFQTLSSMESKVEAILKTNPRRSLSGVYKALRKRDDISLIGNYPLLKFIMIYGYYRTPQYLWNKNQIMRALRIAETHYEEGLKQAYLPNDLKKYVRI